MEHNTNTPSSPLQKHVPKAISNAALTGILAMSYVMLVAPTLEFVSTAQLLRDGGFSQNGQMVNYQIVQPEQALQTYKTVKESSLKDAQIQLVVDEKNTYTNIVSPAPVQQSGVSVDAIVTPKSVAETIPVSAVGTDVKNSDVLKAAAQPVPNPGNPDGSATTANGTVPVDSTAESMTVSNISSPGFTAPPVDVVAQVNAEQSAKITELRTEIEELNTLQLDYEAFKATGALDNMEKTDILRMMNNQAIVANKVKDLANELLTLLSATPAPTGNFSVPAETLVDPMVPGNQYFITTPAPVPTPVIPVIPEPPVGSSSSTTTLPPPTPGTGGGDADSPNNPDLEPAETTKFHNASW